MLSLVEGCRVQFVQCGRPLLGTLLETLLDSWLATMSGGESEPLWWAPPMAEASVSQGRVTASLTPPANRLNRLIVSSQVNCRLYGIHRSGPLKVD